MGMNRYADDVEPPTVVLENENGRLVVGGVDIIRNGDYNRYDHVISIISRRQLDFFLSQSEKTNWTQRHDVYEKEDAVNEDLLQLFDNIADDIHDSLLKGCSVFVHCFMGRSRSIAVTAAYLIKYGRMTTAEALLFLRRKRWIGINDGFRRQLQAYQEATGKRSSGGET